jgi:hypothetical protein
MRFQLLAIPVLAAAAFASSPAETTTYVDGNLTGVSPNTGATLNLSDDKQMVLRTGLTNVEVPYDAISHFELGAVKETSHGGKFFGHGKKTETQLLIVNFKSAEGEEKTMTLELAQPAAASVMSTIQSHAKPAEQIAQNTPPPAPEKPADVKPADPAPADPASGKTTPDQPAKRTKLEKPDKVDTMKAGKESTTNWWGDDWWKTTRNADKWNKPQTANAPDQQ